MNVCYHVRVSKFTILMEKTHKILRFFKISPHYFYEKPRNPSKNYNRTILSSDYDLQLQRRPSADKYQTK